MPFEGLFVLRNHPKTEAPIAGNVLGTGYLSGGLLGIRFREAIQIQLRRTSVGWLPLISVGERLLQGVAL